MHRPSSPSSFFWKWLVWWTAGLLLAVNVIIPSVIVPRAEAASWTTTNLSEARHFLAATSVGNVSLFGGGGLFVLNTVPPLLMEGYTTVVDVYDAIDRSWTTANLSEARADFAATSVGNVALFGGGYKFVPLDPVNFPGTMYRVWFDAVDMYNATDGAWTTANLTAARAGLAATSVGSVALFAGGRNTSHASDVVDIYDAIDEAWTTASLAWPRTDLAATSVGNLALFAGGTGTNNVTTETSAMVDIYNATDGSWTTANLTVARYNLAATSVGTLAFFAGGQSVEGPSAVVDIYNATDGSWTTASLSVARYALSATSVGDVALFAGGTLVTNGFSTVVDIYNATEGSWTTANLTQARSHLAATSVGNVALFGGGGRGYRLVDQSSVVDMYGLPLVSASHSAPKVPELRLGAFATDVLLTPKDDWGVLRTEAAVGIDFGWNITEVDGGSVVSVGSFNPLAGYVPAKPDEGVDAIESFLFSSTLRSEDGMESGRVELQFYLFNESTAIFIGDDVILRADPSYAKFTVRLMDWNWMGGSNSSLVLRVKVTPPFTQFTSREDSLGISTLALNGQQFTFNGHALTEIRLASVVEADGEVKADMVRFSVDLATSEVVLTFSRFNSTLIYDPDVGVLFSQARRSDDDYPIALIVGVSVGGAVALIIVVAVVASASFVMWKRRKTFIPVTVGPHVNFAYDD